MAGWLFGLYILLACFFFSTLLQNGWNILFKVITWLARDLLYDHMYIKSHLITFVKHVYIAIKITTCLCLCVLYFVCFHFSLFLWVFISLFSLYSFPLLFSISYDTGQCKFLTALLVIKIFITRQLPSQLNRVTGEDTEVYK